MTDSDLLQWEFIEQTNLDEFILKMLSLGFPLETSIVGAFEKSGRGSRRDIDLPLHRDGDYSIDYKGKIDIVGLYCIKGGEAVTLIESHDYKTSFKLKAGQALIFDNKLCQHGRVGSVGDRILLRVWISKSLSSRSSAG